MNFEKLLKDNTITTSVPCRLDLGGTLDISTFYLPLNRMSPSSFNVALDMRTRVRLSSYSTGSVKISSRGFKPAVFNKNEAPFSHPLGLMFAVAAYFDLHGVHIQIESESPIRSALGGSSAAAMALIAAIHRAMGEKNDPLEIAWLAHYIEASVAGVPCGMQDQLAAAFGGINQWVWKMGSASPEFEQRPVLTRDEDIQLFDASMLVAYCGIPHVSKDINKQWVESFLMGKTRTVFEKICGLTQEFSTAVKNRNFKLAGALMNQETRLRLEITPDVLDNTGKKLFEKAMENSCGARFTGAGGGGCLWAIGAAEDIKSLRPEWQKQLETVKDGRLLDTKTENKGILVH